MLKTLLISCASLMACSALFAQDKIYKWDGDVIDAKIKTVGTKTIAYQRFDNVSGPEYSIAKGDVEKIVYENGKQDDFEHAPGARHHHHRNYTTATDNETKIRIIYKPNLLTLAPIQFTDNGLGFSLGYERALDKAGIIAFYVPFIATYNLSNGTYYNNYTGQYVNGHQDAMYYLMPGLKLYPTGCYGKVKYGIGPSIVLASGEKSTESYTPTGYTTYMTNTHTIIGVIVNNSLNINPSTHVYLGLEFGIGFTYINRVADLNQGSNGIAQGGFKIGYRF